MRTSFKPFLLGIVLTSVTWAAILYFYFGLNSVTVTKLPLTSHEVIEKLSRSKTFGRDSNRLDDSYENLHPQNNKEEESVLKKFSIDDLGLVRNFEDQKLREEGYQHHAFNMLVSSRLDYEREVPDTRHKLCSTQEYLNPLPNASVIVCFYNEEKHALLRTVHSVLKNTPVNLLHEVILVDDFSDRGNLNEKLDDYMKKHFPSNVILIKTNRREGLIRARLFGAKKATGQVLVFLDSHCEVNREWLQPLLSRIKANRTTVVTPIIDIINSDTFQYTASPLVRGGFNWGLHFKWDSLPENALKEPDDFIKPIISPTMAGGLFAIDREYFFDIGEYDAGMNVWGGENLEISFRIWMCGGRLEIIPCSRVGHVFRRRRPYGSTNGEDTMVYNSLRVAHVWLDDYIEYFFQVRPDARQISYGDVSPRKRLRKLMKCQSFEWYLKNVYPELQLPSKRSANVTRGKKMKNQFMSKRYRRKNYIATYQIRISGSNLCIESEKEVTSKGSLLVLKKCSQIKKQTWSETDKGELVLAEYLCLESSESSSNKPHLSKCHEMGGLQEWKHHDQVDTPLYNIAAGLCLGVPGNAIKDFANSIEQYTPVIMTLCSESVATKWDLIEYKG